MIKKILIADDEKDTVESMKNYLMRKGHRVDMALDGSAALELMKENDYDIVFADHSMPGLTGLELMKEAKENRLRAKIIIMTAYSLVREFFAKYMGADGFLKKPFEMEKVEAIIERHSKD